MVKKTSRSGLANDGQVYCYKCDKPIRGNSRRARVYMEGHEDEDDPPSAHWRCMAGHGDVRILGIARVKGHGKVTSFNRLSPKNRGAVKGLATKLSKGRIVGRPMPMSGMAGSAMYGL